MGFQLRPGWRRVTIVLCLVMAVAQPLAIADIPENKVLVVAGDENFPPYEFIDEINGAKVYRGFNVDLLQAVALSCGYEIRFRPMPWAEALRALDNGEVDAVAGMKYDAEREKRYDFSEAYMINSQAIFVLKDMQAIASLDDLTGRKVAVQQDDIAYHRLKNRPVELVPAADQEEALRLLLGRKVDAAVGNKLTGQYILQRMKNVDEVKTVGGAIDPERYAVAVRKGSPVLAVFNKGLQAIKQNGTYDKLYAKWFGEPVDYPAWYYKRNFKLALFGAGFLFILAIAFVLANLLLKREVKRRVRQLEAVNDELRRTNKYIERAHKYQEKMLNSGYSGIVTIGQDGGIKFANQYAQRYLARDGRPLAGLDYTETALADLLGNCPPCGMERWAGEVMLGRVGIEYTVDVLQVDDERDIIVHFRDITQEKQLREEIIKKDKLEALGKLVACIAHELRNPLTSIKTFVELLPTKYDNPLFRKKISEFVPREIERLNSIVNDLLTYAHPRTQAREQITLKSLVDGIMVFFADTVAKKNIDLQVDIADAVFVYVDMQQMKQVIINILLNAIQALEERPSPRLQIVGEGQDGYAILTITDNGVGISRENINHIFEPFFSTKSGGTGLGLFVSYQLAKQNGVDIAVESVENVGTKVRLKFPAK
ncbi:transporter substrate-binding domain-containing protein [Sporolituus thermophilus]|uniref:histidine kinase n=1 Tax=Sporolituus thermophilus DSM 23256 TaxID=1123285 RepID=A0A1G7N216_9FIRM|nr:transporter substrate-binding domain-containing protein [Sporolituus thermophilus]SDF67956.1 polar amino acid transport system substrate-binding protein [Sporolituus thermophilus DSM 23256]